MEELSQTKPELLRPRGAPEDWFICVTLREQLAADGFRFAPPDLAHSLASGEASGDRRLSNPSCAAARRNRRCTPAVTESGHHVPTASSHGWYGSQTSNAARSHTLCCWLLTGTGVGPTYLVNKEPGGFSGRLWTDDTGAAAGYVPYAVVESWQNPALLGPSHQGYGRLLWHDRSAGDPTARLSVLAQLASEHGCDEVVFDRLHARSPLGRHLRQIPHRVETGYRRYSIKVLSLHDVLGALIPEFDAQLEHAEIAKEISLRLQIDTQTATLRGRPGHLTVGSDSEPVDGTIEGDQTLANLLVGTAPAPEIIADAHTTGEAPTLASVLFPDRAPHADNQTL